MARSASTGRAAPLRDGSQEPVEPDGRPVLALVEDLDASHARRTLLIWRPGRSSTRRSATAATSASGTRPTASPAGRASRSTATCPTAASAPPACCSRSARPLRRRPSGSARATPTRRPSRRTERSRAKNGDLVPASGTKTPSFPAESHFAETLADASGHEAWPPIQPPCSHRCRHQASSRRGQVRRGQVRPVRVRRGRLRGAPATLNSLGNRDLGGAAGSPSGSWPSWQQPVSWPWPWSSCSDPALPR